MSPRWRDVSLGLSPAAIVTKGCHPVGKIISEWRRSCVVMHIFFNYKSNGVERKVTLAQLHLSIFLINTGSKLQII